MRGKSALGFRTVGESVCHTCKCNYARRQNVAFLRPAYQVCLIKLPVSRWPCLAHDYNMKGHIAPKPTRPKGARCNMHTRYATLRLARRDPLWLFPAITCAPRAEITVKRDNLSGCGDYTWAPGTSLRTPRVPGQLHAASGSEKKSNAQTRLKRQL